MYFASDKRGGHITFFMATEGQSDYGLEYHSAVEQPTHHHIEGRIPCLAIHDNYYYHERIFCVVNSGTDA